MASRVPLGFADLKVDVPSHICLFYSNDDELRERLGFLARTLDDPTQVAVLFGKQERSKRSSDTSGRTSNGTCRPTSRPAGSCS